MSDLSSISLIASPIDKHPSDNIGVTVHGEELSFHLEFLKYKKTNILWVYSNIL
jgi:hypothetical protein